MTDSSESLPTDLATAHAMILAERAARVEAEALAANAQSAAARAKVEVANARADLSSTEALIGRLKLEIEKLRRQLYGTRVARQSGWEHSDNQDGHFGGRGERMIVATRR